MMPRKPKAVHSMHSKKFSVSSEDYNSPAAMPAEPDGDETAGAPAFRKGGIAKKHGHKEMHHEGHGHHEMTDHARHGHKPMHHHFAKGGIAMSDED